MTGKNDTVRQPEAPLEVVEAELIDQEVVPANNSDLRLRENNLPAAYTIGKVVGFVGSFLLGFMRAGGVLNKHVGDRRRGQGGGRRRVREKRRQSRS